MSSVGSIASRLRGVVVPLVTPLRNDAAPDVEALGRVVNHVIGGGVDAVFSLGTTGEFARFDRETRAEIARATVQAVARRVPVLVGVSDAGSRLVSEHARDAAKAGADAVVVSLPYYFPVKDSREILRFYRAVADECTLPLVLYNIPATCGAEIDINVLKQLVEDERIVSLKDSSGSMEYLRAALDVVPPGFPVFVGEERLCAEGLEAGAAGLVPSLANVFPRLFADLYAATRGGDLERARALGREVAEMNALNLYSGSWLSAVAWRKTALSLMGICGDAMTEPFLPVDEQTRASIAALLRRHPRGAA